MGEEALRHDEVEVVLGAGHRDVQQPPLLVELVLRPCAEVDGNAAIDGVHHEDRRPFLSFGGMDRRENEVILVEQRDAGLIAGGIGRIERELGQEAFSREG